ncbi:hypothetical protein [Sporosarcina ureae]|uniref:hypothetical protein n=1 Tax=Sporosarcina ureae TaxID=1571 RepID=UPI0026F36AA7|nr:hypothetical protein [Sporosarcina ureae]
MKRHTGWFLTATLLFALAGCGSEPASTDNTTTPTPPVDDDAIFERIEPEVTIPNAEIEIDENIQEDAVEEPETTADPQAIPASLLDYFPPDDTSVYYEGVGNEFAQMANTISRPAPDYVVIHENNGGSYIQKVYKLEDNKIQLVKEELVDFNVILPTTAELDALVPIRTYLKEPIQVGTTFDDWTIVEVDASLQAPYQQFDDVVVVEQIDGDFVNRLYLAEGFGEVKRESIMTIAGEPDYVVTSTLENMTQP